MTDRATKSDNPADLNESDDAAHEAAVASGRVISIEGL
jgi:hypothetical protein